MSLTSSPAVLSDLGLTDSGAGATADMDRSLAALRATEDKSVVAAMERSLEQTEHWHRRARRAAFRVARKATEFAHAVASAANRTLKKAAKRPDRSRKEATTENRQYFKDFANTKNAEYKSWVDNDVFELVDLRKTKCENFVRGRWVLTIKRDKDGNFAKAKARWVLQGFLGKQKREKQTDSPTASRPGFRLACQFAANSMYDLHRIDLKTAFLQGEAYDGCRNVNLPASARSRPSTIRGSTSQASCVRLEWRTSPLVEYH